MTSTAAAAKPLPRHHHVVTNPQSVSEPPVRWRGPIKNSDFVSGNNANNNNNGGGGHGGQGRKKPSYVGLSCSVSGYGPANRYTSPDGRRTSPEQIPVSRPPQILDSVGLVLSSMRQQQQQQHASNNNNMKNGHDVTDQRSYFASSTMTTTTRVFSSSTSSSCREASPGSDSGSSSAGSGNLVQKQIERIYGGKMQSVGAMSPPDSDDTMSPPLHGDSATPQRKTSGGGFFSKRFGLSKQKDRSAAAGDRRSGEEERSRNGSGDGPLDFKPLKVPAVFRLLRPEFRDQLKSNSCQIPGDRTSPVKEPRAPSAAAKDDAAGGGKAKKERVIPVVVENGAAKKQPGAAASAERVIPIQRTCERILDTKPAGKPTSLPVVASAAAAKASSSDAKPPSPLDPDASHSVTSPGLVMSSGIASQQQQNKSSPPPLSSAQKAVEDAPPTPTRRSESPPPPQHSPQRSFDSTTGDSIVQEAILEEDEEDEEEEEELAVTAEDFDSAAAGGIHERAQLCTIMEEVRRTGQLFLPDCQFVFLWALCTCTLLQQTKPTDKQTDKSRAEEKQAWVSASGS